MDVLLLIHLLGKLLNPTRFTGKWMRKPTQIIFQVSSACVFILSLLDSDHSTADGTAINPTGLLGKWLNPKYLLGKSLYPTRFTGKMDA